MNIRPRRVQLETIKVKKNQVYELAKELDIRLDNESIREILDIGTKSPYSEEQLERTIRELEDRKKKLENDFREIALQCIKLESKYVGLRTQIGKIFRDNLVQVFHLCSRTPNGIHERLARDELIHKYIKLSKSQ